MRTPPILGLITPSFLPVITLASALIASSSSANAQTMWTNTDSQGGGWSTSTNWSTNVVPTGSNETKIDNGGWAKIDSANAVARAFTVGDTTTGNRLSVGAYTFTTRAGTLGSAANSSGSVTIANGGTWRTNGSGSYSSFYVGLSGTGTLVIDSGGSLYTGDPTRIASGAGSWGAATVRGYWEATAGMSLGLNGNGTLNIGQSGTVTLSTGTLSMASGAGAQGVLNIGGAVTAEGAGRLNAIQITSGTGATINFNHTDSRYRFASDAGHGGAAILIAGSTKVNVKAGTTILDAANTYTGATTVSGGVLLANNVGGATSATGNGTLLVESGGTLGGTGRIAGAATIHGILKPGDNGGILSFGNALTLGATSETIINIDGLTRGTDYTGFNVTGLLTLGGKLSVVFSDDFALESGETVIFDLFDSGSVGGDFTAWDLPTLWNGATYSWDYSQLSTNGQLSLTSVPEPGMLAVYGVGASLLAYSLRRSKRRQE